MRTPVALPAALCAAIGLVTTSAWVAEARSPVAIEGADHDTREAILDLLPDRDEPKTLFEAERIAEEAAQRARAWLRSQGYYAATVTPEATESPASARLIIAPGPRFTFNAPELSFDGGAPSPEAAKAARDAIALVAEDAPARAADVLGAEAAAVAALQRAGYADAAAGERRVVVDHATNQVSVQLNVRAGAYARLGALRVEPSGAFHQSFLNKLRNWRPGEEYSPDHLAQLRRNLSNTGAVARVSTRLEPAGPDGVRDVVLEIEPAKRNAYELGFGYSTAEGVSAEAEWTRRNITGRADSLSLGLVLGERLQSASVQLLRPHTAGLNHARRYALSVAREDTEAYSREGVTLRFAVEAAPRLRQAITYGVQLSADRYDDTVGIREALVLTSFADFRRDTTGAPLDPRRGYIFDVRVEPSVSSGDATLAFVRGIVDARGYHTFGANDRVTLAARSRVGWLEAPSGSDNDVPPDRRFYAGGGGSVRGYAYNSIYPLERDALGLTPGGQGVLEVSGEARLRFRNGWGAAAFIDGGNAFDDWEGAGELLWGVGLGARYELGFAPLRIDVAVPLDRRDGDDAYALYISLGQAF